MLYNYQYDQSSILPARKAMGSVKVMLFVNEGTDRFVYLKNEKCRILKNNLNVFPQLP